MLKDPRETCLNMCEEIRVYIDLDCREICRDADDRWLEEVKKLWKKWSKKRSKV